MKSGVERFGRSFLDDLLLALVAGSVEPSHHDPGVMKVVNERVSQARSAILGPRVRGRPEDDDDDELLQMAYWYDFQSGEVGLARLLEDGPDDTLVAEIASKVSRTTPLASKRARTATLIRKFKRHFERMMRIIHDEPFEQNQAEYADLMVIQEIFRRHGIGFDLNASSLRKAMRPKKARPTRRG